MKAQTNRAKQVAERLPPVERQFIGWSGNPWTPEQQEEAIRLNPEQQVFWRSLVESGARNAECGMRSGENGEKVGGGGQPFDGAQGKLAVSSEQPFDGAQEKAIVTTLDYLPHAAQMEIHRARGKRFRMVCTGRRFGKTLCLAAELLDRGGCEKGGDYGWVAPTYGVLSLLYLRRVMSQRDWDSYIRIYGIPPVFIIGPPSAVGEMEKEYQMIAQELSSNGRGYLPNGSDIKYVNGGGGHPPFREQMEYTDRLITLIGTGGLLTMLTEAGSGTLAGGAHSDTFQQIARGDAALVSGVFQRGIDVPVLATNFPGQPVSAYFQFAPTTPGQVSAVAQEVAALAAAGYRVDPAQVLEKTGYRVTPVATAPLAQAVD